MTVYNMPYEYSLLLNGMDWHLLRRRGEGGWMILATFQCKADAEHTLRLIQDGLESRKITYPPDEPA